jgi:uncharacterized protein HemX
MRLPVSIGNNCKLRLTISERIAVSRSASHRRYRDEPVRTSAAGSAFVLTLGIILILVALAGGFVLSWKARMVSIADEPEVAVVDLAQVCTTVNKHNTDFAAQVATTLRRGVEAVLNGDQAAGDKADADVAAMTKDWTGKLRAEAARTDNADLRAALNDLAAKLKPVETGEASLDDMTKIVDEGNVAIAKFCPKTSPSP